MTLPADPLRAHFNNVLGHDFRDQELLLTALTHRSFGKRNNERLEYLGDALLSMFIAEALFSRFPQASENELSRMRSHLVKQATLAQLAQTLDLGAQLRFGPGEHKSGGGKKESLLADAMEALVGAVYLDSDAAGCRAVVLRLYAPLLDGLTLDNVPQDPKTRLQECMQARKEPLPEYRLVAEEGEDHARLFTVACHVAVLEQPVTARGKSKRVAAQEAARLALERIGAA